MNYLFIFKDSFIRCMTALLRHLTVLSITAVIFMRYRFFNLHSFVSKLFGDSLVPSNGIEVNYSTKDIQTWMRPSNTQITYKISILIL